MTKFESAMTTGRGGVYVRIYPNSSEVIRQQRRRLVGEFVRQFLIQPPSRSRFALAKSSRNKMVEYLWAGLDRRLPSMYAYVRTRPSPKMCTYYWFVCTYVPARRMCLFLSSTGLLLCYLVVVGVCSVRRPAVEIYVPYVL